MEREVTYTSLRDDIKTFLSHVGVQRGLESLLSMLYCAAVDARVEEVSRNEKTIEEPPSSNKSGSQPHGSR